jgi:hypothetical protein
MNNSILSLWHIMSQEQTIGLVKRLFLVDASVKIFGIYRYPEKTYGLAFSFSRDIKINLDSFRNLKELTIQLVQDMTLSHKQAKTSKFSNDDNCINKSLFDVYVISCTNCMVSSFKLRKESRFIFISLEKEKANPYVFSGYLYIPNIFTEASTKNKRFTNPIVCSCDIICHKDNILLFIRIIIIFVKHIFRFCKITDLIYNIRYYKL